MHTLTSILPRKQSDLARGLLAVLAALAVAFCLTATVHADNPGCDGSSTARTFQLWAKPGGSLILADGAVVNIWGYTDSAGGSPTVPGPQLNACEGETITVVLHNALAESTSLAVHGQPGFRADTTGIAAGSDNSAQPYTFQAQAGTFLYQAGLTDQGAKQAALGLYGALVVYPNLTGQAYAGSGSNYAAETVLVLSEIDPALNGVQPAPVNPLYDMQDYAPKYWLLNGQSFPQTTAIAAAANSRHLVRYVNAGFLEHSMGLLGLDQTIIATNGHLYPFAHDAVAETVPPGDTLDAILAVPASGQYPLYDANQHLDNNGARGVTGTALGGMFTTLAVAAPVAPPNTPPVVTLSAPADGTGVAAGETVAFAATAADLEEGDVSASLVWTSNLDGPIGTGPAFSTAALSVGTHTITAVATDSGSLTGSAAVTVIVTGPTAADDGYSLAALDGSLTVPAPGVLGNDAGISTVSVAVLGSGPTKGTLTLNADGSFTYAYAGSGAPDSDTFTYQVHSGAVQSNVATVTLTIH